MQIKEMEIDGFKSYAQTQRIFGFDPSFNAITGLNGSGKSNILDAICFVLGISNLSQVRAAQLQDLVHKQGQAGVTKATVTITFDNRDPNSCPLGYEKHPEIVVRRQVIIGGRNTFTINGTNATNQRVMDLFRSVGLNVNNPHFLIMQGRITKVLNMKPVEILGMIEEAAGTKMYEAKKQSAVKTIEKKDAKVQEINKLLAEDIQPQVAKLRSDRAEYVELQTLGRAIDIAERRCIAFEFVKYKASVTEYEKSIAMKELAMRDQENETNELQKKADRLKEELAELSERRRLEDGGERKRLEDIHKEESNNLTTIEGERDTIMEQVQTMKESLQRLDRGIKTDQSDLNNKKIDLHTLENDQGGEEREGALLEENVRRVRMKLDALAKGMTTDEQGNAISLETQLTEAKRIHSTNETNQKMAKNKLNTLRPSLVKKQKELATMSNQAGKEETERAELMQQLATRQAAVERINFDEQRERDLTEEFGQLNNERRQLEQVVDRLENKYPTLRFNYVDPSENFNRLKVKGVFARLVRVVDERFCLALQVAGGASLNSVVVADSITSQELIANGRLNRRVTFIPLDKIDARPIEQQRLQTARKMVGAENVYLASELVEYANELTPAVQYVLGRVLICATDEIAKRLAYDQKINARCVTLAGDDFNPGGTLTGGSRAQGNLMLMDLFENAERMGRLETVIGRLNTLEDELQSLRPKKTLFQEQQREVQRLQRLIEEKAEALRQSPVGRLNEEIAAINTEITKQDEIYTTSTAENKKLKKSIEDMETRKNNEKAFQDRERQQAQKELSTCEKALEKRRGAFEKSRDALATLRAEIATMEEAIANQETETENLQAQIITAENRLKAQESSIKEAMEKVRLANKVLSKFLAEGREKDKEMVTRSGQLEDLKKEAANLVRQCRALETEMKEEQQQKADYAKRLIEYSKKYTWIEEEQKHFGKEGTNYHFAGFSGPKARQELEAQKTRKEELEKKINVKAMHQLAGAEEQAQTLEGQKLQLERDKKQLLLTIQTLDIKKREEIIRAHEQVNRDFGSIFSTLLPGTSAKLKKPANAESVLEGLEVKVAFNNKWKDSLAELSGGQRSLVALSLVLAMLKFKPAPIYILDEVDAALDLSHTQNIGAMIKTHFKESQVFILLLPITFQFIIVSLKDGMFNHANVLFTTKFIDGTSTVSRVVNQ